MITKNGALIFANKMLNLSSVNTGELTRIDGEPTTTSFSASTSVIRSNIFEVGSANQGIVMNLGSGTTPPTVDDYWLDEPLTSDDYYCSSPAPYASVSATEDGQIVYTFAFTALRDITINEICISANANTNAGKVMIARKIVPTRHVSQGEIITFSFAINL